MADTTEKKTYLVNIESNLKKYSEDAAEAKKKVDELTISNKALKDSGTASTAEIEANNAALRNAQKEYSNKKKLIDLAIQANKAEAGSYEQLYKQHALLQTALKLESATMMKNTDGTYKLTEKYIQLSKEIDNAKKGLDQFGKGIHDNRLNVGNYSEAIEGALGKFSALPGPVGRAATAVQGFGTQLKALLLNPIMLAIAAISGAMVGLYKVFVSTAEGAAVVKDMWAGMKAQGDVLRDRVVTLIDSFKQLFKGEFTEAANLYAQAVGAGGTAMKDAYDAALKLSAAQRELNKQLAFHISEEADENLEIQKYLFLSKDKSLADGVRLDMLQKSLKLMETQGKKAAFFAEEQFRLDFRCCCIKSKTVRRYC
jgi:hypothetical protein